MIEIRHGEPLDSAFVARLTALWAKVAAGSGRAFVDAVESDNTWTAVEQRLEEVGGVAKVLVVGIGGSSLGTQVIAESFRASSDCNLFFLEGVDRYKWDILRNVGDWRDRHIVIVSKSGGTLETLTWLERLAHSDRSWINPRQVTVIAGPGPGAIQAWAGRESLPILGIPKDLSGRFSVLSPVGMFPAGLMGLSRFEFREGANWALGNVDLAAQLAAAALKSWEKGQWVTQMWTYSEALRSLGLWWSQLWAESLAKKVDRSGSPAPRVSTPLSCLGSRDQHSMLQQLMEGHADKFVLVTRVKSAEAAGETFQARLFPEAPYHKRDISLGGVLGAEAQSFELTLRDAKISHATLDLHSLNERTMGALFMIWQMAVALMGEYLGIDAFNQPGVELGKGHVGKILRQ